MRKNIAIGVGNGVSFESHLLRFRRAFLSSSVLPGWVLLAACGLIHGLLRQQAQAPSFLQYLMGALLAYALMTLAVVWVEHPMGEGGALHSGLRNWQLGRRRLLAYRLGCKLVGLALCLMLAGTGALPLLLVQPEPYRTVLAQIPLIAWIVSAAGMLLVGLLVDACDRRPWDGYYLTGRLLCQGRLTAIAKQCRVTLLFSLLRGFFLVYGLLLLSVHHELAFAEAQPSMTGWGDWLDRIVFFTDFAKITIGIGAFLVVSRALRNAPRSVDTHPLSWLATFACYPPISTWIFYWIAVSGDRLASPSGHDGLIYVFHMLTLTVLSVLYSTDVLAWGGRFSQLSYRGLVAGGPFAYIRHPAYLSKCLILILLVAPGLTQKNWLESCTFIAATIILYSLRAHFEERHLRKFPEYTAWYCRF